MEAALRLLASLIVATWCELWHADDIRRVPFSSPSAPNVCLLRICVLCVFGPSDQGDHLEFSRPGDIADIIIHVNSVSRSNSDTPYLPLSTISLAVI